MDSLFKQYSGIFDEEIPKVESPKKQGFAYKPFALQNAIGEKSAKKIWIEYQKLRLAGITAEELIFNIINKIKDMEDLKKVYTKLVTAFHLSRMESNSDLDIAIEKTILNI